MATVSPQTRLVFDANRAAGIVAFSVEAAGGVTRRREVREQGPLRVRFPNGEPRALEAVIVNTAGGIAGGDALEIKISVGADASLVATTAAAEKVYRSIGGAAQLALKLQVAAGGQLCWLPNETIMFDRAQLSRRIEVDLTSDASLVLAEALIFGRAAMGEAIGEGSIIDRWRVRRSGRLVFAETTRLEGAISQNLSKPAIAKGAHAIATVLLAPADEERIAPVRELSFAGEAAISAWNGFAVARLCAPDGASLRHDLMLILAALKVPLPRLWAQ